jgi:hypothetical protein
MSGPFAYVAASSVVTTTDVIWVQWNQGIQVYTDNSAAVSFADTIWQQWAGNITTGGAANYHQSIVYDTAGNWLAWNQAHGIIVQPATSPEELARIAAAERQRQAETLERKERRDRADKTAEKLLLDHLSAEQRKQYAEERHFEIVRDGGRRRYRIKHGWAGNVEVYNEAGKLIERLCIHPDLPVPYPDNMLAQKLLLEADEKLFRKTANITRVAA